MALIIQLIEVDSGLLAPFGAGCSRMISNPRLKSDCRPQYVWDSIHEQAGQGVSRAKAWCPVSLAILLV